MQEALILADESQGKGEVPIGAVVWQNGSIISRAHNETEKTKLPTAHAECLAIQRACASVSNWRLPDCALCVTLEPCTMCIGAIQLARIPVLIYGASDQRIGAVGSVYDATVLIQETSIRVISGVREKECREILTTFFKSRRISGSNQPA